MKFRELLNLYKKDQLPEKEKPIVEEEIDKFEALSDYVYSEVKNEDLSLDSDLKSNNKDTLSEGDASTSEARTSTSTEEDFTRNIQRQIRKAFMKMGVIVLIAILIILLFVQLVLPPIVSSFYYNPAKIVNLHVDEDPDYNISKMALDFRVFSDLTMPMENRTAVLATPKGYGKYDLSFTWTWQSSYDKEKPSVSGQLVRDNLTLSIPDFIKPSYSRFTYTDNVSTHEELEDGTTIVIPQEQELAEEMKYFVEEDLKAIDDDKMLKVAISFKEPISFNQAKKIEDKYDLAQTWYAVATSDKGEEGSSNCDFGFALAHGGYFPIEENAKYPHLFNDIDTNADAVNQHFISMLKYMSEQKDFFSMLEKSGFSLSHIGLYEDAYKYVKKNGVNIYGCAAFVDKKTILKMIENDDAYLVRFMEPGQQ